jgi:hypothetical protein
MVATKEQVIEANRDNHLFKMPEMWKEGTMEERLMLKCSGCGDTVVIVSNGRRVALPPTGPDVNKWLDEHWPCTDEATPLGEAFTLEEAIT